MKKDEKVLPQPVTLEDVAHLAIQANEAGQQALAGCLYAIIEASDQLTLDELFGAILCFRRGDFKVERVET